MFTSCLFSPNKLEKKEGCYTDDTVKIEGIFYEKLNDIKYRVLVLDNGMEVWQRYNAVYLKDSKMSIVAWNCGDEILYWKRAKIGQPVCVTKHYKAKPKEKKILEGYSFELIRIPDYIKNRIVKEVNKYDGYMSKLEGHISGGFTLVSGNIEGNIEGGSSGSQNFYVNVYFTEGDPLTVNVRENPLYMDLLPGDTIQERMTNNLVTYIIKKSEEKPPV